MSSNKYMRMTKRRLVDYILFLHVKLSEKQQDLHKARMRIKGLIVEKRIVRELAPEAEFGDTLVEEIPEGM